MRPRSITIQGLRSFRSEVEIDFGDRTQIAVIGDTGAGKSSILEAMTFALYGQTSQKGQSKQELMNDTSDTMRVVLRFRVSGEEWEVARVDRRTGSGLRPAKAQLVRYGPEGETIEKVEQVKQVNGRIRALIGLDSDAFLRTVILPQGRFARLLVEDTPSARTDILRQVWRTQELEDAGAAAGRRLEEVGRVRVRLEDEVARQEASRLQMRGEDRAGRDVGRDPGHDVDDPKAHLEWLVAAAQEAEQSAEALAGLRDRAGKALDALRDSEAVTRAAQGVEERVDPAAVDRLRDRLAPVEREQRRLDAEREAVEAGVAELTRRLHSIPSDDGAGLQTVAQVLAALDAIPGEAERAVEAAVAMRAAVAGLGEAEREAEKSRRALEEATERLKGRREGEAPLAEAVESVRVERQRAEGLYDRCAELRERVVGAAEDLVERVNEHVAIQRKADAARSSEKEAKREAERAEEGWAAAQRANAAAAAAHDLCPGDECPVCERDLPEGWTPPPDQGLAQARKQHTAARAGLAEARRAVSSAQGDERAARRSIADLERQRDRLRADLRSAMGQLRQAAGLDALPAVDGARARDGLPFPRSIQPGAHTAAEAPTAEPPLPPRPQLLAPVSARLRDAESRLDEHSIATERLRTAHTAATIAAETAGVTLRNAASESARTHTAATAALEALRHRVQSIPPPFQPTLALPADPAGLDAIDTSPVDRARYAATERQEILEMRESKRQGLREEIEKARARFASLQAKHETAVEQPLQAILEELNSHRTAVAEALRSEAIRDEFEDRVTLPAALFRPDPGAIGKAVAQLRRAMKQARELAADLRQRALQSANAARAEARRIAEQLDPPADPADLSVLFRATTSLANEAEYAARDAERARANFTAILDDILDLHRTAREVSDLERALGDINAALKPGAFLKWLTLRRSRDLLVYASRMLMEMTGDRYAFADPGGQDDQQWLVIDNDSGQARTPASLSGGEQFIGSLALALGMVEMMARSGGRLESLFLDEGFGSLDRGNLDSAIDALATVAGTGRMVGVISHVGAVAEQIDDVLAVTREPTGSRAAWLTRAQRQQLARADAGEQGASALAGLLD